MKTKKKSQYGVLFFAEAFFFFSLPNAFSFLFSGRYCERFAWYSIIKQNYQIVYWKMESFAFSRRMIQWNCGESMCTYDNAAIILGHRRCVLGIEWQKVRRKKKKPNASRFPSWHCTWPVRSCPHVFRLFQHTFFCNAIPETTGILPKFWCNSYPKVWKHDSYIKNVYIKMQRKFVFPRQKKIIMFFLTLFQGEKMGIQIFSCIY